MTLNKCVINVRVKILNKIKNNLNNKLGMFNLKINHKIYLFLFRFGIFLLVSAPAISAFFLIISLIHSCILNWRKIFKDKWNYLFIIASLLMIFIAFFQSLELNELSISIFEINNQEVKERLINWNSFSSVLFPF